MKMSTAGIIWTASASGWTVLAIVTQLPEAALAAAGCGAMSLACWWVSRF